MISAPDAPRHVVLLRIAGRHVAAAELGQAEELGRGRHRVGRELAAAGAGPRAGAILDFAQPRVRQLAGAVRADRLEDVLDRESRPSRRPGAIEPP